ncbi:hypothetical protein JOJ86_002926 [Rhodococcus percolatus]|uniref:hypothetical protein n=1 Tax=Rhodococcus opacus TaxID=37919 RepID=UPI0015F7A742|nr:hypothetical protein [Rhodococcus opacus]MBA8959634.1 hypothetical protein [Rhodococcus opacus]MBP2205200.1 hypothetical protein [Rhodococcus opacus]
MKKRPGVGWVRGDKAMTLDQEREILDLRKDLEKARQDREEAQRALVEDTSELAQGDDLAPIGFSLDYSVKYQRHRIRVNPKVSWDDVFSNIGTMLIDEASVQQLKTRCESLLSKYAHTVDLDLPEDATNAKGVLLQESWDTIELQFRALGLIDTGVKKRGVQDLSKYLRLTEKGVRHLAVLRAIRRDAPSPSE